MNEFEKDAVGLTTLTNKDEFYENCKTNVVQLRAHRFQQEKPRLGTMDEDSLESDDGRDAEQIAFERAVSRELAGMTDFE
jgi:hypothetical protein